MRTGMIGMIVCNKKTFVPAVLFVLMHATSLSAQFSSQTNHPLVSASVLTRLPISEAGGPIATRFVDPFMTTQQVERIYQFLNKPCEFKWDGATSLRDIQGDLANHLPVVLDITGLEELGIDVDEAIYPELTESGSSRPEAVRHDVQDPFSPVAVGQINEPATSTAEKKTDPRKWWRDRKHEPADHQLVSNGARLFYFLESLDMTLNLQLGQLVLTTSERAEQHCCVRIFEVTPLVDDHSVNEVDSSGYLIQGPYLEQRPFLIDVIQATIDPDTWEALGGPSTITCFTTQNRKWLVVSSPLVTHWKIEALLTKLNE